MSFAFDFYSFSQSKTGRACNLPKSGETSTVQRTPAHVVSGLAEVAVTEFLASMLLPLSILRKSMKFHDIWLPVTFLYRLLMIILTVFLENRQL